MNKTKLISLILIIIGLLLSSIGVNKLFTNEEEKTEESPKIEEEIKKNPKEIAVAWIGEYQNEKENTYHVIFEDYDTAQIMVIKNGFDYILQASNIDYDKIDVQTEKGNGVLKRNSETFDLSLESNDEYKDKLIDESFKKIETNHWTGIYIKNNTSVFITKITDSIAYISFVDEKLDDAIFGMIFYNSSDVENTNGNLISEEKLQYKTEDNEIFTVIKDGEDIKVEYLGENTSLNIFNETFEKYKG